MRGVKVQEYLDRVVAGVTQEQFVAAFPHYVLMEVEATNCSRESPFFSRNAVIWSEESSSHLPGFRPPRRRLPLVFTFLRPDMVFFLVDLFLRATLPPLLFSRALDDPSAAQLAEVQI